LTELEASNCLHSAVCEAYRGCPCATFNFLRVGDYCWLLIIKIEGKIAVQIADMNQDHTEFLFSRLSMQRSAHENTFDDLSRLTKISLGR